MTFDRLHDARVRAAAFDWLREQVEIHGDVLPWQILQRGFDFGGQRVPMLSQQGIFKPKILDLPISIRSSPDGPYEDFFSEDDRLIYAYEGTNPHHPRNVGLRRARELQVPLVYFLGIAQGKYLATFPVKVVSDDPAGLTFGVQVDDATHTGLAREEEVALNTVAEGGAEIRRGYLTRLVRHRLHQRTFRERVLSAYRRQCAICRLRHDELLDAAHIIEDHAEQGIPTVPNGLSLCKLHHAAFDRHFLGIRPDHRVLIRPDLLGEKDGPTLLYSIQGLHNTELSAPRKKELWPDPHRLEARWERFLKAAG